MSAKDKSAADSARLAARALRVAQSHILGIYGDEVSDDGVAEAKLLWRDVYALAMRLEKLEHSVRIKRAADIRAEARL